MKNGKNTLVVEYFNAVWIDLAWEEAEKIYTKVFQIKVEKNDVVFIENNHLKGGIKVYKNDLMVDMSYRKVEIQMGK